LSIIFSSTCQSVGSMHHVSSSRSIYILVSICIPCTNIPNVVQTFVVWITVCHCQQGFVSNKHVDELLTSGILANAHFFGGVLTMKSSLLEIFQTDTHLVVLFPKFTRLSSLWFPSVSVQISLDDYHGALLHSL
jgi:hypothetical protein